MTDKINTYANYLISAEKKDSNKYYNCAYDISNNNNLTGVNKTNQKLINFKIALLYNKNNQEAKLGLRNIYNNSYSDISNNICTLANIANNQYLYNIGKIATNPWPWPSF